MTSIPKTAAALPELVITLRREWLQTPYLKEETWWEEGEGGPDDWAMDDSELEARLAGCVREERR